MQNAIDPPIVVDGLYVVTDEDQCVGLKRSAHPPLRTTAKHLAKALVVELVAWFQIGNFIHIDGLTPLRSPHLRGQDSYSKAPTAKPMHRSHVLKGECLRTAAER